MKINDLYCENGFYDVSVLLKNITGNSYSPMAEVYIKLINEEVQKKLNATKEDISSNQIGDNQNKEIKDTILENIKENKFLYGFIGIILIAIVITILVLKFKPKKKRR